MEGICIKKPPSPNGGVSFFLCIVFQVLYKDFLLCCGSESVQMLAIRNWWSIELWRGETKGNFSTRSFCIAGKVHEIKKLKGEHAWRIFKYHSHKTYSQMFLVINYA